MQNRAMIAFIKASVVARRLGDLLRDAKASLAGIIYIDIYAVS